MEILLGDDDTRPLSNDLPSIFPHPKRTLMIMYSLGIICIFSEHSFQTLVGDSDINVELQISVGAAFLFGEIVKLRQVPACGAHPFLFRISLFPN